MVNVRMERNGITNANYICGKCGMDWVAREGAEECCSEPSNLLKKALPKTEKYKLTMNISIYLVETTLCFLLFYFGHHTAGLWAVFLTLLFGGYHDK